jgi:hypothetical protein
MIPYTNPHPTPTLKPNTWVTVQHPESGVFLYCAGRYFPGDPGRYFGPPEKCYEAEPAEFDMYEAKIKLADGLVVDLCKLPPFMFSDLFWDELAGWCLDAAEEARLGDDLCEREYSAYDDYVEPTDGEL